jgi:transcriptional regulator with XRE-family HTH domain
MRDESQLRKAAPEPIGKRIARLRAGRGWTQQSLAARLAISRVAVSHIEMELSYPSERTITLLAGWLKLPPHELVAGTTYPRAKGEKLPLVAPSYTPLEMELSLFENDLAWLDRLAGSRGWERLAAEVRQRWTSRLESLAANSLDESEREALAEARELLRALYA